MSNTKLVQQSNKPKPPQIPDPSPVNPGNAPNELHPNSPDEFPQKPITDDDRPSRDTAPSENIPTEYPQVKPQPN